MPPNKCFDAFLSFNSLDRKKVRDIAARLEVRGLKPYLEEWEIRPGSDFQPTLAEALLQSKACVVFLGPNGLGPWQKQEIQVAIDAKARDEAFCVIPVLLPGTERPRRGDVAHLEFLINASWVEFLRTIDDSAAFERLVWGVTGKRVKTEKDPRSKDVCPYRGLEAFTEKEEEFFFGRENLTGWLISALRREVRAPEGVRFLGVLGPSGSGKSSVVRAGMIPRLNAGAIEGSDAWRVAVLRPGDDPLANLASGVASRFLAPSAIPNVESILKLAADLKGNPSGLDLFARTAMHDDPSDTRMLVVVDQFEEVFTYRPQDDNLRARFEAARTAFISNLLHGASAPGGRVAVVLTMRSDFLGACASFEQLGPVLSAHQELVGPMTASELLEAIERPAYLVGHEVQPELAIQLLADVEGRPGALPLLQFALKEIWRKRDVHRLTLDAYNELGEVKGVPKGIEGVLENRANAIYNALSPSDQALFRQLLLRLVQSGEGAEDTKRRVLYRELIPADLARTEAVRKLIRTLSARDARLITAEGTDDDPEGAVEVAHEALIQGWTLLREWIEKERGNLRTRDRLIGDAREWRAARPEDKDHFLQPGARLAVSREWAQTHKDELTRDESNFLAACEKAEKDELAAARRSSRNFKVLATLALAFAVASGGLAWWANRKRLDADFTSIIAESRRIAALSEAERINQRFDRSLLLAFEANEVFNKLEEREKPSTRDKLEARNSLFRALEGRPELRSYLVTGRNPVTSVAFSPVEKVIAVGYRNGDVVLFGTQQLARSQSEPIKVPGEVKDIVFSPKGNILAVECKNGDVVLLDTKQWTRKENKQLGAKGTLEKMAFSKMAFSPDGRTLAVGFGPLYSFISFQGVAYFDSEQGTLLKTQRHFDYLKTQQFSDYFVMQSGSRVKSSSKISDNITNMAFSPDGHTLALAVGRDLGNYIYGYSAILFDSEQGAKKPDLLDLSIGLVSDMKFSPNGATLAVGYGPRIDLIDTKHWVRQASALGENPVDVLDMAFSPNGRILAVRGLSTRPGKSNPERVVDLFDATSSTGSSTQPKRIIESNASTMAFSLDGHTLAVGYDDSLGNESGVILFDPEQRSRLHAEPIMIDRDIEAVAFSPDGQTLAVGFNDSPHGGVILFDGRKWTKKEIKPLNVEFGVKAIAFSPDRRTLAVGCGFFVYLFDAQQWTPLQASPLKIPQPVNEIAFSPDSQTLAVAFDRTGYDPGVILFDAQRWTPLQAESANNLYGEMSVAFSPDGRALALCSNDKGVSILDLRQGARPRTVPVRIPGGVQITARSFSPDGRTFAVSYGGERDSVKEVVLFDAKKGTPLQVPLKIPDQVKAMAFSTDGHVLAVCYSGFVGQGIVLFDGRRGMPLQDEPLRIVFGAHHVQSLVFSPDDRTLYFLFDSVRDGFPFNLDKDSRIFKGVAFLDVNIASWKRKAGAVANRNFTRSEWRKFFPDEPYRKTFDWLPEAPEEKPTAAASVR